MNPSECDFKCVARRRFILDETIPLPPGLFLPGAQYTADVASLPAAVKFILADGAEKLRIDLAAGDPRLPEPPFAFTLLLAGDTPPAAFTTKDGATILHSLIALPENFRPTDSAYAATLRFETEGGASNARAALSAGIGQADMHFVSSNREKQPYFENGRLFFTHSARSYGTYLGVSSIDPENPSDIRLEGVIFFDYGDGQVRNDTSADLFYDDAEGLWKAYASNFSTAHPDRAPGGITVAWSEKAPLHGVSVMRAKPLDLPGMNEDPSAIWDPEVGKWRLLLSEFMPESIRASMWESEAWDGPFARLTEPVPMDSTGTTIAWMDGVRHCLFGSVDRAYYVRTYPFLEPVGTMKMTPEPWGNLTGWPHGRGWPCFVQLSSGKCLMLTMDRINFPGMPEPNWTYGGIYVYVS